MTLGTEYIVSLSTRFALGWYVGAFTTVALMLGYSTFSPTMALATLPIPSGLCLASFSSCEAALSKSKAHKRTRIDKEKKNKKTEEPEAL